MAGHLVSPANRVVLSCYSSNLCRFFGANNTMSSVLLDTNLPGLERIGRGKVRDIYKVGEYLLIVTTDRISAFDYILATGIPDKGRVLNQMTLFWLDHLRSIVPNHLVT